MPPAVPPETLLANSQSTSKMTSRCSVTGLSVEARPVQQRASEAGRVGPQVMA